MATHRTAAPAGGRQRSLRDLAKEIHASLYCSNPDYQRAAIDAHYRHDAAFEDPLVSVTGTPSIIAQFLFLTWFPAMQVEVSSVYETFTSLPGRTDLVDVIVVDSWVTFTLVPGLVKLPIRFISKFEFDEHQRVYRHEDIWSVRDVLANLPIGLGWVYGVFRKINGAVSSVAINAIAGLQSRSRQPSASLSGASVPSVSGPSGTASSKAKRA
ncbi:hypothetical protein HK105_201848 [Polyrhizophydium stewartii]|uniref:SnoaL-like domain-containing protein n=1 Tax=Polyrhizophydium stewartii TaxID=2732419 RepID=A0ABR4NG20_9FUNG